MISQTCIDIIDLENQKGSFDKVIEQIEEIKVRYCKDFDDNFVGGLYAAILSIKQKQRDLQHDITKLYLTLPDDEQEGVFHVPSQF
jgi:hypothetical protein